MNPIIGRDLATLAPKYILLSQLGKETAFHTMLAVYSYSLTYCAAEKLIYCNVMFDQFSAVDICVCADAVVRFL